MYVNQLFPLFLPCSAREIIFFIVLLDEQKIARTFSNDKGVSNFNFAGMENYIMVKQSGRWLNELNSWNTFYYAKFVRLLRSFDCMKTWAMSKFCNGIYSQWNKRYQVSAEKKFSSATRLFFQKVNITWMWISLSCRLKTSLISAFSSSSSS